MEDDMAAERPWGCDIVVRSRLRTERAEEEGFRGGAAELAERVRAARAKIGMTRKQLAAASGASERYLANIEQSVGNPSLSLMSSLATALDIALAELLPLGGEQSELRAQAAAALRRVPEGRLPAVLEELRNPVGADVGKAQRIVLVGLRGAGKSSLGAALAKRLDAPFFEISHEVERAYGADIGALLELSGQSALRRYEREVWEAIVEREDAAVVGAPGAIVAEPALYERLLASAHSIWLQATPEDHMSRVIAQGDLRPMADNRSAMSDLKAILAARSGDYARCDATLNTSAQDFEATSDRLEAIARSLRG
jgi:XRE family transcriptional regulator, aerobic/anaerobic benzoate catabolism transcriptional regulator